jgi:catechol 2,3-dioxygenase-like lactoylglutathione lyase family enzyme
MIEFLGMRHLALRVSNIEQSVDFYSKAFGMRPFGASKLPRGLMPMVSPNLNDQITLMEAGKSGETSRELGAPGETGGIDHFGFVVSADTDMDELREHIVNAGATFIKSHDVAPGVPSEFFKDPNGYVFQITRFPDGVLEMG